MDSEEYRKDIERKILYVMEMRLKAGTMDAERAREIARYTLNSFKPHMTLGEIYRIVPTLDDQFAELAEVVIPVIKDYETKVQQIISNKLPSLVKANKIDEATEMVKNANAHNIDLAE